jgi:hypothetical protein
MDSNWSVLKEVVAERRRHIFLGTTSLCWLRWPRESNHQGNHWLRWRASLLGAMLVLLLLTLPHRAQATATAVYSPSNVPTLKPSVSLQPTAVPTCSKDSVLEVTAPASGDLIYAGEPFEITWTSGGK